MTRKLTPHQAQLPRLETHTFDWCGPGKGASSHEMCHHWYVSGERLVVCSCDHHEELEVEQV